MASHMCKESEVMPMVSTVEMRTQAAPLTLVDYAEMPYSPALLLDSKFDASLTDDPEFRIGCKWGFDAYFEFMYRLDKASGKSVFVAEVYTWHEVVRFILNNVMDERGVADDRYRGWRAGFLLGWLSALALTDRVLAVNGLAVVERLVVSPGLVCQEEAASRRCAEEER